MEALLVCPDRRLAVRGADPFRVSESGESSQRRLRLSVSIAGLCLFGSSHSLAYVYILRVGGIIDLGLGPSLPWALGHCTSGTSPGMALILRTLS